MAPQSGQMDPSFGKIQLDIPAVPADAVREELRRVLESRSFGSSKRAKQFLQFVVEETLLGRGDELKERLLGVEIFGRKPDYSTGEDPIVRVQAGEVRRRLDLCRGEAKESRGIQIALRAGSYVPVFSWSPPPSVLESPTGSDPLYEESSVLGSEVLVPDFVSDAEQNRGEHLGSKGRDTPEAPSGVAARLTKRFPDPKRIEDRARPHKTLRHYSGRLAAVAFGVFVVIAGVAFVSHPDARQTAITRFWNPFLRSNNPVLLCMSKPAVYRPSPALYQRYQREHPQSFQKSVDRQNEFLSLDPSDVFRWDDMVPRENSGPALGGVVSALNLGRVLTEQHKAFEPRFGQEASFTELRDSPGVIIGSANTVFTNQITSGFAFVVNDRDGGLAITETGGEKRVWRAQRGPTGKIIRDYALITRQMVSKTGQPLVQLAGITDSGTQAASELVSDPSKLLAATANLQKGWEAKNLEIVVTTDISEGKAGPPKVVATYVW
jgi:hypothetical protein